VAACPLPPVAALPAGVTPASRSSGRDGADTELTGRGCRQGVKLLFEDHTTGVMLLQAPGSIPSSFNVYLAGVNATAGAVPAAGACIQHPGGGGKRIAIASGACAPGAFAQAACPYRNAARRPQPWHLGTARPGC